MMSGVGFSNEIGKLRVFKAALLTTQGRLYSGKPSNTHGALALSMY